MLLQDLLKLGARPADIELRQLQQALEVFDHRRVALSGTYLVDGVGRLVQIAGCQRGKEQRLTNLRRGRRQLQRVLQIAHRRIGLARSHARARQARLQSNVVGRQSSLPSGTP